jgi:hypothetical protein
MPSTDLLTAMNAYNQQLVDAGVMVSGEGLKPSSEAARVVFSGTDRSVIDGPFAETKELVAGFWIWKVASMDEAIEWAKRCPNPSGDAGQLELRPVFESDDFGEELTPELREAEVKMRTALGEDE